MSSSTTISSLTSSLSNLSLEDEMFNAQERYEQLHEFVEASGIDALNLQKLVVQIETSIYNQDPSFWLSKKTSELPYTLYHDSIQKLFHIKIPPHIGKGTHNTVFSVISIPYDTEEPIFTGAIRIPVMPYLEKTAVEGEPTVSKIEWLQKKCDSLYKKSVHELDKTQFLQKPSQRVYSYVTSDKPHPKCMDVIVERLITVSPLSKGDLSSLSPNTSFRTRLFFAVHVCHHLGKLHARGYLHNDIKPNNMMWNYNETSQKIAFLTDFGMSFQPRYALHTIYSQGYYGYTKSTPYEMLEIEDMGDIQDLDHFAVEKFALGIALMQIIFQKSMPWEKGVAQIAHDSQSPYRRPFRQELRQIHSMMQKEIEDRYHFLEENTSSNTIEHNIEIAILSLMRLEPEHRISLERCISLLSEYHKTLPLLHNT